jgi:hypothetical protein
MRNLLLILFAAALGAHGQVVAQSQRAVADPAAFAGNWTLDLQRSELTDAERRTITPTADAIRVDIYRAVDDHPPRLVYKLDGSETVNPFGNTTASSRLRNDDQGLMLDTVYAVNGQAVTVQEVWTLNADRSEMTVATVIRVEHGYEGVQPPLQSAPPNVSKTTKIFQRQPSPADPGR